MIGLRLNRQSLLFWGYLIILVAGVRGVFFYQNLNRPLVLADTESYLLAPGRSLSHLSRDLEQRGVLHSAIDLRVYARLRGLADDIRAGEYALEPGMSALDLLEKLARGEVIFHQVVLPEGWTTGQILRRLQSHSYIEATLPLPYDELRDALGWDVHPEGQFFPDTYNFTRGSSDRQILLQAHQRLQQVLAEEWQRRALGLPFDDPYQALILASIVEKETAVLAEQAEIAGVFIRRLQRNMRLQTDPTVIYGMGADFDGNLTRADLRAATPYNTYTNGGLPPTPIALAGRGAIAASMNPEDGDTLYFVARGDGSHQFSATLEEHNAAVREYQIEQRAQDYRSRPETDSEEGQ